MPTHATVVPIGVSSALIVPLRISLMEERYGRRHGLSAPVISTIRIILSDERLNAVLSLPVTESTTAMNPTGHSNVLVIRKRDMELPRATLSHGKRARVDAYDVKRWHVPIRPGDAALTVS